MNFDQFSQADTGRSKGGVPAVLRSLAAVNRMAFIPKADEAMQVHNPAHCSETAEVCAAQLATLADSVAKTAGFEGIASTSKFVEIADKYEGKSPGGVFDALANVTMETADFCALFLSLDTSETIGQHEAFSAAAMVVLRCLEMASVIEALG